MQLLPTLVVKFYQGYRSNPTSGNNETEAGVKAIHLERRSKMATTVENRRETSDLIGSDKVEGTAVYGADERKIGSVQRVMIDKISGRAAYVVMSFGGFLGMGEDYYPMPWEKLKYDTRLGGYRVDLTEAELKGAPKFDRNTDWDWANQSRERVINDYYNNPL
jgi:PRC-barrel domain